MAKYIELEVALALIKPDAPEDEKAAITIATAKKFLRNLLYRTPVADVAPVVHGRWLTWEEMFHGKTPKKINNLGVFCSSCKNHADNMFDFCPNCGAKMDGGAK
nr:MAG TPA: PROTEIN/RNA Complex, archaeal, ribosomal, 50S, protein.0A [Caudoviricetes sp.]